MKLWDAIREIHYDRNKKCKSDAYFIEKNVATGAIECFWFGISGIKREYSTLAEKNFEREWEECKLIRNPNK